MENIREQIALIPAVPGVYLMKDATGAFLYVGKALNLKFRVSSYFSDRDERYQIPRMLEKLDRIEWIICANETEALVLEANLVREHQPPYNILLRDDKHYPYVCISNKTDLFPRIRIVRSISRDGNRYFGPFTDISYLRRVVAILRKQLKIRHCSLKITEDKELRPCLDYAIGICSAPCAQKISLEEYRKLLIPVEQFFAGHRREIISSFEKEMYRCSEALQFERAAQLRDTLVAMKKLILRQSVDLRRPDFNCDVFAVYEGSTHLCLSVMLVRNGVIINQNNRLIPRAGWEYDGHGKLIVDYYLQSANDLPEELIFSSSFSAESALIQEWFLGRGRVKVVVPHRGDKLQLIERAEKAARLFLSQQYLTDPTQLLEELAHACQLPKIPRSIEAFDISNLGDRFTVAGMVHFTDGVPVKSEYRRFRIKTVSGQNDFAMMMEAVSRRLSRLQEEEKPFPDLLLIDGGKGQLSAAAKALALFENPPMLLSLAKKEELLISPYCAAPVQLGEGHPVRRLVERIRNEVHRFAIQYHRNVRGRQFNHSLLEEVSGIGSKKAQKLITHFGSAQAVSEATLSDIIALPGISKKDAENIHRELRDIFGE